MMSQDTERNIISREMDHIPVLYNEVLTHLSPKAGEIFVDGTFGAGGHTSIILSAANCRVVGIDRDSYVEGFAQQVSEKFPKQFQFFHGRFSDMLNVLSDHDIKMVDGILLDLGVSSMQLDTPRRGFSFMQDGPLDMRMGDEGRDAAELINTAEEELLAGIIFKYADERYSRKIARAIVSARRKKPITRTGQLASIIHETVGKYNDTIDPATRTFQALRVWVNDEIGELQRVLEVAEQLLSPEGRLAVISFHSGEDKIVKQFLHERSGVEVGVSRHQPLPTKLHNKLPTFVLPQKKAITATDEEVQRNPRSRSARLRVAVRTEAPNWQGGMA